jgi:hypothetical protein
LKRTAGSPLPAVEIVVMNAAASAAVDVGSGRGSRHGRSPAVGHSPRRDTAGSPSPAVEIVVMNAAASAAVVVGSGRGSRRSHSPAVGHSPRRAAGDGAAVSSGGAAGGKSG